MPAAFTLPDGSSTTVPVAGDDDGTWATVIDALLQSISTLTQAGLAGKAPLSIYATSPDLIATGAITRSASGAATAFAVAWPDGATGVYAGTESTAFPGQIDSYTVTHVLAGTTKTYTRPTVTRDTSGEVTTYPAMTVS